MATKTLTGSVDTRNPSVGAPPAQRSASPATSPPAPVVVTPGSRTLLPHWAWITLAVVIVALLAAGAAAIHSRTQTPTLATTPAATDLGAGIDPRDHSDVVHGAPGHVVDGNGTTITSTASTSAPRGPGMGPLPAGSHGSGTPTTARFGRPAPM